jgi:hypothetical protein
MHEPILSYFYNNKHYYSKFACCEAALLDNISKYDLHLHIKPIIYKNPDYFNNYDFTVEPSQSWYEMCVERAHVLRQKHKYLALAFSGGSDSAFILDLFIKNNIPLDEVYTVLGNPFKQINLPLDMDIGLWEVYNHAIPYMKYLEKEYNLVNTKFTVHNYAYYAIKGHYNKNLLRNFHQGMYYTPSGNLHWKVLEDYKAQDKFIINGAFEAIVQYDGKYYTELWDTDNTSQFCHRNYIPFFCPKDAPEMHAKQCHLLMKYFKQHGYVDKKKDFANFHIAQIKATRKWLYNFNESPYFNLNTNLKTKDPKREPFANGKSIAFMKALNYHKIGGWKDILNEYYFKPRVKNIHLYDLPFGFKLTKQYLE